MRRHPVTGNEICIFCQTPGYISMQIHRRGDDVFRAHNFPDLSNEISFRIIEPDHTHRSVYIEIKTIQRKMISERVEGLIYQGFISLPGDRTTRKCIPYKGWNPDRPVSQR